MGDAADSLMTLREVAAELRVSVEFVRQRCVSGRIRSVTVSDGVNKARRVRRAWLDEYKRSLQPGAASALSVPVTARAGEWHWSGSRKRRAAHGRCR